MKRETKRRIAYYQEALPDMKKKVTAAAMMLLVAAIVSVTAAYAWMTLSVAPVVSSVNTTMSANGTLEIALSNPEGTEPEDYDIDESATMSTDVTVSNLRWGNLVNLSDSSYGIDKFVLRPAQLNTASLKYSPLWGAMYGADGRISTLDSNYTYAKWDGTQFLGAGDEFGVRAIASYTMEVSDATDAALKAMENAVTTAHSEVNAEYSEVSGKMPAMSPMITKYAQGKLDDTPSDSILFTAAEIKSALDLYVAVYEAMVSQKDAYVALANLQLYKNDSTLYVPTTWADIAANKNIYNANEPTQTSKNGIVSLTGLTQFIADLQTAEADIKTVQGYYDGLNDGSIASVSWSQLSGIVAHLIDQGSMKMLLDGKEVPLTSLSMDNVSSLLGGDVKTIYIYNGIVKRFEQLAVNETTRMRGAENGASMQIKVTKIVTVTINGVCYTKAAGTPYYMQDYNKTKDVQILGSDVVAKDTYGIAVDFWLRTNAEETYLTLEGAVATDVDGTIYSYDGVNRVWGSTGNTNLTTNSTTQGGGSCYIYYADTPEDMMRSLDLLRSMKVAFVDKNGGLLAQASMDTDHHYAVNGRVTVPLTIESSSGVPYTYVNAENAQQTGRAITQMTHDESLWVTAIIYLDGAYLTNDHVLAAADIDGQLNVQFGSSVDLETLGDKKLEMAERSVVATATPTTLDWALAQQASDLTTNVTVTVDGTAPENMTAFFVRAINSTQGERQGTMTFTQSATEKNKWTGSYQFDSPGVYYLRHVRLDGVDYALENPVMVEVKGFSISEVKWGEGGSEATVYSPESVYEVLVEAKVGSDDPSKMPKTVQARFLRDDGIMVNVDMRYDPSGKWSGTGTFYRSGNYTLQYMLLDGEYYDVSDKGYSLTLYLGLNVAIYNAAGSSLQDEYEANVTYNKTVGVVISDNDGNALPIYEYDADGKVVTDISGNPVMLPWVADARLRYSPGSSAVNSVDSKLEWSDENNWFTAILPITAPGRYTFYDVTIGSNNLTRATEAPVYTVMPPDPPRYVTSQSTALQFAPMTNDGFIGPIKITDSQTAALVAEVYNSVTDQTYLIPNGAALDTYTEEFATEDFVLTEGNGTLTYDSGRDGWFIKPVYKSGETDTQEGVWSVKNIYVWNYMDESGTLVEFDRHAVWSDSAYDYSGLTTEISCSLKVVMDPGQTTLGSATTPFMTSHYVKDIGMKITMQDNAGRTITGAVLNKMAVSMKVDYASNTGGTDTAKTAELVAKYGYEVSGSTNRYTINFVYDEANACWVINESDSNHSWQYVGEYPVYEMSVTLGGKAVSADKISGVPEKFAVISATPTVDNLTIGEFKQNKTTFGTDYNGDVTGKFLDSYGNRDLGEISVILQYYDEVKGEMQPASAAVIPITVEMDLTHIGKNQEYGGYTWSGSNALSAITLEMKRGTNGTYTASTTPLLAGVYKVSANVTCGGEEKSITGKNISVYSMKPTVTMESVTPSGTVMVNANTTDPTLTVGAQLFEGNNVITNDKKSAVVFAAYAVSTKAGKYSSYTSTDSSSDFADYTMPKIEFKITNVGDACKDFTMAIPNNGAAAIFAGNNTISEVEIGNITVGSATRENTYEDSGGFISGERKADFTYETEKPNVIGTQRIDSIIAKSSSGNGNTSITYTLALTEPISIVQENETPPSISFVSKTYYTPTNEELSWSAPEGKESENGRSFEFILPTVEQYGTKTAEVYVETDPTGWSLVSDWQGGTTYHVIYSHQEDGTPTNHTYTTRTETIAWFLKFTYYTYKCDCANRFWFDVYQRNERIYERTASVDTYDAVFGLQGWSVNGVTYAPGESVVVESGNVLAIPIIGELSRASTPKNSDVRTQTGTTYIDVKLSSQYSVDGNKVSQIAGGEDTNQNTAKSNAETAAKTAARTAGYSLSGTGYAEVSSEAELLMSETAIVEGAWR